MSTWGLATSGEVARSDSATVELFVGGVILLACAQGEDDQSHTRAKNQSQKGSPEDRVVPAAAFGAARAAVCVNQDAR